MLYEHHRDQEADRDRQQPRKDTYGLVRRGRLFNTLIRFDAVYHDHFKVNLKRIKDYPNLSEYVRELYRVPGVSKTVSFLTSSSSITLASGPSIRPKSFRRDRCLT